MVEFLKEYGGGFVLGNVHDKYFDLETHEAVAYIRAEAILDFKKSEV